MSLWGFDLWPATLAFARIAAMVMLLPGIGEQTVPAPARLAFALFLSLMLMPEVGAPPSDLWGAMGVLIGEVVVGLALGAGVRIVMAALGTAGQILGIETGLSFAQTADPTQDGGGQTLGVFLALMGVTLVFATDLHHQMLLGVRDSYALFAVGGERDVGQFNDFALTAFATSFRVGVQIAAPVIVAGLVYRVGLGVLARLSPAIQVFFVAMPLNVLGGFLILTLGLSAGMLVWLDALQDYPLNVGL